MVLQAKDIRQKKTDIDIDISLSVFFCLISKIVRIYKFYS
jgi:hypothetical protein